jgi:uncharacterized protein
MDLALAFSALLLGLAGAPHCAAMCGPSCAVVLGGGPSRTAPLSNSWAFHGSRIVGYALAGGLAAGGVAVLSATGSAAPVLRPLWTLLHVAALALGLWLLATGRQPEWMTRVGRPRPAASTAGAWQPMSGPLPAAAAGAAWIALPCGLLQSALVVAALANTPQAGAGVMASFAVSSAAGLHLTPWLAGHLSARRGGDRFARVAIRLAGLALAAGSAWGLGHDVWDKVVAYCT